MKFKVLACIFVFTCLMSCQIDSKQELRDIGSAVSNNFKKLKIDEDYLREFDSLKLVVLPGTGCTGCITQTEDFLVSNYDKREDVIFILTSIESIKILKNKLLINWDSRNIILDTLGVFSQGYFDSIYPSIVSFDNEGQVSKLSFVSPEDDGLSDLLLFN